MYANINDLNVHHFSGKDIPANEKDDKAALESPPQLPRPGM